MRTERGLDRLTAFLDAVVAIAITLLVLPLIDVLQSPEEDLGSLLWNERGQFGAFLLSFVVIARLWLVHHQLTERVGAYDTAFLVLNIAWILTVVLLPFATQVLGQYGSDRLTVLVYVGTMTASSALLTAMSLLVWRRPVLRRAGSDGVHPAAAMTTTAAFALALVIGVAVPAVNYWGLLLLLLTGPAEHAVHRRLDRSAQTAGRGVG